MNRETIPAAPLDYASLPPVDLSRARIILDDGAAREFLAAEGMLGQLEPEPPYTSASLTWRSANTNAVIYAVNFRGCGDDGYTIISLPLDYYSLEQAALIIAIHMQASNLRPGTEMYKDLKGDTN